MSKVHPLSPLELSVLRQIARKIHTLAREKDWHNDNDSAEVFLTRACNNLHGEVSELWEAYRNGQLFAPCDKAEKMKVLGIAPLTCAEEELADIVIRALDDAERLAIDIGYAVARKHAFNAHREPRHGGKLA